MSRLIDADALIDGLKECKNNKGLIEKLVSSFVFEVVIPYVEQQPTAYDVDKVVEQLEEELNLADKEKERCARENKLQFDSAKSYAYGISIAIDIAKAGGKDERIH